MSTAPRLSIGLPVYNGEQFLSQALDSLLGQTFGDFELIISDNASTDGTEEICRRYAALDDRIRYLRQARNVGSAANHNIVFTEARGELFKFASDDDLYGRDLLQRCIAVLDDQPDVVLVHAWTAMIDGGSDALARPVAYGLDTGAQEPSDRFRSLLFDDGGDDDYGVIRTDVLRRVHPYDSYYHADRTIVAEIALHGRFAHVPDWLYFRRDHAGRMSRERDIRSWCVIQDSRRANRLRHPLVRLLAEYVWGYVTAIRTAPLSRAQRWRCYRHLAGWVSTRAVPPTKRWIEGPQRPPSAELDAVPVDLGSRRLVPGRGKA